MCMYSLKCFDEYHEEKQMVDLQISRDLLICCSNVAAIAPWILDTLLNISCMICRPPGFQIIRSSSHFGLPVKNMLCFGGAVTWMRGNRLLKTQHLKYVMDVIYPLTEVPFMQSVRLTGAVESLDPWDLDLWGKAHKALQRRTSLN